ncbi:MAG: DUF4838 domain-containing protein [Kiritimatiellia bacterium]
MKTLFAVALSAISVTAFSADSFIITAEGQPKAQIVTGEKPPETVAFAAKELQAYIKKMSGAELPVVAKPDPKTPSILLGPAAREKIPAGQMAKVRRDGYIIGIIAGELCIAGIDDSGPQTDIEELLKKKITHSVPAWSFQRGTLYGVYRLLEELGMRWFMPGDFGERAPEIKSLVFSGDILENPHFISRTVGYWSLYPGNYYDKNVKKITVMPGERAEIGFTTVDNRMWELRMRGATYQIPLNHYPTSTRWVERFGKTHPEYFALLPDGTRDCVDPREGHLCYTCSGVAEESAADIKAYAAGKDSEERGISRINPITKQPVNSDNRGWPEHIAFGEYFSLLPHDGFRACTCPNCLKMVPPEIPIANQRHSRLVWDYIAKCAELAPDNKITCLAYGTYSIPYPGMKTLPPNVTVGYCGMSHPASLYYKDAFERYEKLVEQWSALSHGQLAFWQHYLASNRDADSVGMPEHTPEMYAKVVRVMAKHGNHVFCEQMADSIMFELFNRYLLMKMFYNPDMDEKEIFKDYMARFYGADAGQLIGEIYADIGKKNIEKIKTNAGRIDYWTKIYTDDVLKSYHAKAAEAAKKAAGTPYEKAVAAFDKYYLGLMDAGLSNFNATMGDALKAKNPDFICLHATKPPVIDGKTDDDAWQKAEAIQMYDINTGITNILKTEVKSCYDDQNIYFAVTAYDPDSKKLKRVSDEPGMMDGIEIFIDNLHSHQGYYQMTFDLGGRLDERHYIDKIEPVRIDWRSQANWKTAVNEGSYCMEIAIPRKSLEAAGRDLSRETWGVMAGRTIAALDTSSGRFSCTSARLRRGFHQPALFNDLIFKK